MEVWLVMGVSLLMVGLFHGKSQQYMDEIHGGSPSQSDGHSHGLSEKYCGDKTLITGKKKQPPKR